MFLLLVSKQWKKWKLKNFFLYFSYPPYNARVMHISCFLNQNSHNKNIYMCKKGSRVKSMCKKVQQGCPWWDIPFRNLIFYQLMRHSNSQCIFFSVGGFIPFFFCQLVVQLNLYLMQSNFSWCYNSFFNVILFQLVVQFIL